MNVTLKNVPQTMKEEAKRNRRSLNAEMILALMRRLLRPSGVTGFQN